MVQVEKKGICVLSFSETLNLESVHHPISQANSRNHVQIDHDRTCQKNIRLNHES